MSSQEVSKGPPFFYGGQAVIEGVMIRGRKGVAIAVRRPGGSIIVHTEPLSRFYTGRLRVIPVLRGVIVLIETLVLGIKALMHSANLALQDESPEQQPEETPPQGGPLSGGGMWLMLAVSLAVGVGIFFVGPLLIARALDSFIASDFLSNLLEGVLRLGLFIGYLVAINRMPDIRRVFAYHGAEHKTVHAHENHAALEVATVRTYAKEHPRCGTAFLLLVLVIAILVFALLGRPSLWLSVLSRVVLLPVVAGLSYEALRFGGAHHRSPLMRVLLVPGLALQRLTTREPEDDQIEVAIASMKGALVEDGVLLPEPKASVQAEGQDSTEAVKGENPEVQVSKGPEN